MANPAKEHEEVLRRHRFALVSENKHLEILSRLIVLCGTVFLRLAGMAHGVAMLKSYELTVEYQISIEPLLEKLADELKFAYSYDDSPHKRGRYLNNVGEVERERHVKIEIYVVSQETIEKIAQAICELKDGHKKKEQECVAIKEIVGVYLYPNKNLKGRPGRVEKLRTHNRKVACGDS